MASSMRPFIAAIRLAQLFSCAAATRRSTSDGDESFSARRIAAANAASSAATSTMPPCRSLNRRISGRSVATTGTPITRYSFSLVGYTFNVYSATR